MRDTAARNKQPGEMIREWREGQSPQITQAVLAEKLGISTPHLSGVENGDRSVSLNVAIRIERETGVPVEAWEEPRPNASTVAAADAAGLTEAGDVAPVRASA